MLPAPSIVTTLPTRSIAPSRSASASPVQREKNPDSASTAAVRWLSSGTSAGAVSSSVEDWPR